MAPNLLNTRYIMKGFAVGLLFLMFTFFFSACSEDEEDPITIRIFSYYTDYTGSYIVNGGPSNLITSGTPVVLSSGDIIYYSELSLGELDQVEVNVAYTSTSVPEFIAIRVYRDGIKVKEAVASSVTALSLTYTYDEEDVSESE